MPDRPAPAPVAGSASVGRARALAAALRRWQPPAVTAGLRDEYLAEIDERGEESLRRDSGPEHVTASCFVFSPGFDRVLLCFHGKGRFWVQLGGHIEPEDASVAEAALREAREESGLAAPRLLGDGPADIDRHALPGAFGHCRVHWDVGYAAVADPGERTVVSDESEDVAWWPVDALPEEVPPGFAARLARALTSARRHS